MPDVHDRRHIERAAVEQHVAPRWLGARLGQQLRPGGEQGDQVGAGRMAHQHDIATVDAEFWPILLHGGQRPRHVAHLFQRRRLGLQAVIDAGQGDAARQPAFQLVIDDAAQVLVAVLPAAAVDHQDQRRRFGVGRDIEIEALFRPRAVGLVLQPGQWPGLRHGEMAGQQQEGQ